MKYLFFLLITFTFVVYAQTAKEIIGKHLQALGGQLNIYASNSYSFEMDSSIVYYKKQADGE